MATFEIHFNLRGPDGRETGFQPNKENPVDTENMTDVLMRLVDAFPAGQMKTPIGDLDVVGVRIEQTEKEPSA